MSSIVCQRDPCDLYCVWVDIDPAALWYWLKPWQVWELYLSDCLQTGFFLLWEMESTSSQIVSIKKYKCGKAGKKTKSTSRTNINLDNVYICNILLWSSGDTTHNLYKITQNQRTNITTPEDRHHNTKEQSSQPQRTNITTPENKHLNTKEQTTQHQRPNITTP